MKVTVTFEVDERTGQLFLQSSIERVINTSMTIVSRSRHDDASINYEDWEEWKPVVTTMWHALHDKIFRSLSNMEDDNRTFTLRKGEL